MNATNFNAVLDQIKAHPEKWGQNSYHCGTKHCFAGWAQILAGKYDPEVWRGRVCTASMEEYEALHDTAEEFLGISVNEACYLFSPDRTIEDFEAFLQENLS